MLNKGAMKWLSQLAQAAFLLVTAVAVYSFVSTVREGERLRVCTPLCHLKPDYAARNRTAPDFTLDTLSHGKINLASLRGKVVFLNFWTKNCGPCLEEMPSLAEFTQSIRGNKDVVVLTVSTDESLDDVRSTLNSVIGQNIPFIAAVDPESKVVGDRYGTKLFPETWVVDSRGVIRARFDGTRDWNSPLVRQLVTDLTDPLTCSVEFEKGRAVGDEASTCEDVGT
jgi:thiol-disulfide isomerase/thioredoxin